MNDLVRYTSFMNYFKSKRFLKFVTNQNTPRIIKCDFVLQINENRVMN